MPARVSERGNATAEFSLVAVLLVFLLLGVAQVAVYLWVRGVAVAGAAEGARWAANADVETAEGATRAADVLAGGLGAPTAARLNCVASDVVGDGGVALVEVRCRGRLPVFFAPLGAPLPLDARARAIEEGGP